MTNQPLTDKVWEAIKGHEIFGSFITEEFLALEREAAEGSGVDFTQEALADSLAESLWDEFGGMVADELKEKLFCSDLPIIEQLVRVGLDTVDWEEIGKRAAQTAFEHQGL